MTKQNTFNKSKIHPKKSETVFSKYHIPTAAINSFPFRDDDMFNYLK